MSTPFKPPVIDRLTIVLRPAEGQTLEQITPYVQLGAHVAIGRGLAVISACADRDVLGELSEHDLPAPDDPSAVCAKSQTEQFIEDHLGKRPKSVETMHIDDRVKMAANARRYEWLRDSCGIVEYKAIAGSIGPGMLPSGENLDSLVDQQMNTYPGEQEGEPCAD